MLMIILTSSPYFPFLKGMFKEKKYFNKNQLKHTKKLSRDTIFKKSNKKKTTIKKPLHTHHHHRPILEDFQPAFRLYAYI